MCDNHDGAAPEKGKSDAVRPESGKQWLRVGDGMVAEAQTESSPPNTIGWGS